MKKKKNKVINTAYLFFVFMFLYIPIMVLVAFSFNKSKLNVVWTGFTFKWYGSLFQNSTLMEAVKNSFTVAIISTIIATILGTLAAVGLYRYKFKGKNVIDSMLNIPLIIPEIVMGISLLAFFSIVNIERGLFTLIIAHVTFSVAYVVSVVRARLDGFNKSLEEAAMDLGATPLKTFTQVTLPVIMPGVVAGALMAFTLSLDDVVISFFVAGAGSNTLPLKVFSMVKFGVTPEINALSTIIMLITVAVLIISMSFRNINLNIKRIGSLTLAMILIISLGSFGLYSLAKGGSGPKQELNIFNWSEYLPESVIEKFEETYNIKVNYSTFSSNEEMLAKLMAGGGDYDIAVASDFMVEVLIAQNLLQEINKDNLTNLGNIGQQYMNLSFDEGNKFSIPYMWLAGIIGYDSSKIPEGTIKGYKDLWNSEFRDSIVVLDDQRAIIGITLKMLGYSINETSEEALAEAEQELMKLKPNIKAFDSDSPKTSLINGEAKIIFAWGAESSLAARENPNIKYVIPEEGLFLQQDNFVIPKGAKNVEAAELFIDFIMQPEISAEISEAFPYGNPNTAAYELIDSDIMKDVAVYPPEDAVAAGEHLKDVGDKITLFDKIWMKFK